MNTRIQIQVQLQTEYNNNNYSNRWSRSPIPLVIFFVTLHKNPDNMSILVYWKLKLKTWELTFDFWLLSVEYWVFSIWYWVLITDTDDDDDGWLFTDSAIQQFTIM